LPVDEEMIWQKKDLGKIEFAAQTKEDQSIFYSGCRLVKIYSQLARECKLSGRDNKKQWRYLRQKKSFSLKRINFIQ
jgi:hypothetical protein